MLRKINKRGFTLVELLAVIVILGVLSTIGVVSVNRYLTQSRKKSYKIMSQTIYEATMNCITQGKCAAPTKDTDGVVISTDTLIKYGYLKKLDNPRNNSKDCSGSVVVSNKSTSTSEYQKYNYDVQLTCDNLANNTLTWPEEKKDLTPLEKIEVNTENTVKKNKSYKVGESVKYNPVTDSLCDSGALCYTWYVIKNSTEDDDTISMILNKNLGEPVALTFEINHLFDYTHSADCANAYLKNLTSSWKYKGRLITGAEISSIVGTIKPGDTDISNYPWLYENLCDETSTYTSISSYYWIDKIHNGGYSWKISCSYYSNQKHAVVFTEQYIAYNGFAQKLPVRPVIDIKKQAN